MTKHLPIPLDRAFVRAGTPSFQDLIDQLAQQSSLFPNHERDMSSGLRRVAKALGLPPSDVPCDPVWLQPRLNAVSPALLGVSKKTWQNTVSNARAAMVQSKLVERRRRKMNLLSPAWRRLWGCVCELQDRTLSASLSRFVDFLCSQGIEPDEVDADHARAYRDALRLNEIRKDPETGYIAAIDGWNLAITRVPGWPSQRIERPSRQTIYRLPTDAFPASFLSDVDKLIVRLGMEDPLAEDDRRRALRPATLAQYRQMLIRFASELVHAGIEADTVTSVNTLLDPAMAELGLRQMLSRTGNKTGQGISDMAGLLRSMGKVLCLPEEDQARLGRLARKLAVPARRGLTEKNRARLRVLQQSRNQRDIFNLPAKVFKRSLGNKRPYYAALERETALAIAILLVCPLRIRSLANLELGKHVQRPGDGRVYLVLQDHDTKTGQPIEFELPSDVVRLLDTHLATRAPYMCPPGTGFVFPKRCGGRAIDPGAFAGRIPLFIKRELGLEMNAHLFRHFAVMTWLDANPGGYEVARRLLGHSEVSSTINMYSGMETRSATRAFSDLVSTLREGKT